MLIFPYLSALIWLPIVGGFFLLLNKKKSNIKMQALLFSLITFIISLGAFFNFHVAAKGMQLVEDHSWIAVAGFKANYYLGVDGISLLLILLTTLMTTLVVIAGWTSIKEKVPQYFAAFLIMEGLMCGVFAAQDALLFYVFWEVMLVPMLLIVGIWGGPNRIYAAIKFFLYTFFGSVFMLIALLYLHHITGSFRMSDYYHLNLPGNIQNWLFLAFLIAFAVKVPMFPVHTWLPDAHVEAPTGGSVILAAIMLKMGGYGFLRFSLPILPHANENFAPLMIVLSLIAVFYIGFVAIAQTDMKKLIAYSSIAHMGFVTLGYYILYLLPEHSLNPDVANLALQGSIFQMLSHGFISGGMFLCVGVLYDRMHTRNIADYGGVANTMPIFAALVLIFAMANCGLPGTSGFVGELFVTVAAFHVNVWLAVFAATILVLGPAYTLWMYKRVIYGPIANEHVAALTDINYREKINLFLLMGIVFFFGIFRKCAKDTLAFVEKLPNMKIMKTK